jgi:putative membrane protein
MWFLKLLLIIIIMMLGAAFAVLNADPVHFNYYFGTLELPLSLIVSTALGVGVVIGILSGIGLALGLKRENVSLKRRSRLVNEEIKNLRNMPLKEE